MGKVNYCESCGGVMEFDVAAQGLRCPNCNTVVNIENHKEKVVEHKLTRHVMETIKVKEKTSHTMECHGCGAVVEVDAHSTASRCPYCDASFVLAEKQMDSLIPDGVIPFKIDKNRVGEIFRNWMKRRWLAPNELKHLYQQDRLQGIYIPYWTFDANVDCSYTAQGGRDRVETYRNKEGKRQTRKVTDWFYTSGVVSQFFDDILIKASNKLNRNLMEGIEPFYTKEVASYSPDYFSGYVSECFSIELERAHKMARDVIEKRLVPMARKDALFRFDQVKNIRIRPSYRSETYKHILLPIYAASYTYKKRQYSVLINGQNGKIKGYYPKSPIKIILLAILGVILLAVSYFYSLTQQTDMESGNRIYEGDTYYSESVKTDEKELYAREMLYNPEYEEKKYATDSYEEEEQQWDYLDHNLLM